MAELNKADVQVIEKPEDVEGVFDRLGYTAKGNTQRIFSGQQVFADQRVYTLVGLYEEPAKDSFGAYLACRFTDNTGKEVSASAGWWRKSVYEEEGNTESEDKPNSNVIEGLPGDVTTDIEFYKWACGRKFRCFQPRKIDVKFEWDKDMQPPKDSRRYKEGLNGWWKRLDKPRKTWVYRFAVVG